jgi:hypothetical protein
MLSLSSVGQVAEAAQRALGGLGVVDERLDRLGHRRHRVAGRLQVGQLALDQHHVVAHLRQDVVDRLVDLLRGAGQLGLAGAAGRRIDDRLGLAVGGGLGPRGLGPRLGGIGLGRVDLGLQRLLRPLGGGRLVERLLELALVRLALELQLLGVGRRRRRGLRLLELADPAAQPVELAAGVVAAGRRGVARLGRRQRLLGGLAARDLGLGERVLRDAARALGRGPGVDRLLELDLDLGQPALELLAILVGRGVLLPRPS